MSRTMTYEQLELNGCYAMLCEALRAWYRIQHDHIREIAAKTLKDVYGYEFHSNGSCRRSQTISRSGTQRFACGHWAHRASTGFEPASPQKRGILTD